MSQLLFEKHAYVQFGPADRLTGIYNTAQLFSSTNFNIVNNGWPYIDFNSPSIENNKSISNLRISFTVKKTLDKSENKAEIKVYNISEDTWNILRKYNENYKVSLAVGYGKEKTGLFTGDIETASYTREGADWVCTINGKDGQNLIQDSYVNSSFKEGTNIKKIVKDIINKATNVYNEAKKQALEKIDELLSDDKIATTGMTISGQLTDALDKILKVFDASVSVQDEKFQIIKNNSNNDDQVYLISPTSGLLGSPKAKSISESDEGIEFRCLLIPLIKPGSLVKIESKSINDYYRIDNIDYKGDTHTDQWECQCDAIKPSSPNVTSEPVEYLEVE